MASDVWDLVVVGAGPAGSAAALAALRARPGARVLLLDKADFPRDKSCGDGIAPHALDELARLGAASVLADRVPVHRLRLTSPDGTTVAARLQRPDFVVPRTLFDARLVEAAVARGAVLRRHAVRTLEVRPDVVVLDGDTAARAVVGADGATGVVRRQLGLGRQPDDATALAVRGYAPAPDGEPEQTIVMDGRGWPAYAWSFAAGDGTTNVGFGMLLPHLRGGKAELHGRLQELLPGTQAERLVSHHLPLSTVRPHQPRGRVLLAGDAASLINPLTGEGIFYALLSGRLAGLAAVTADDAGAAYGTALQAELGRHLRHTGLLARASRRTFVVDAGVAAAGRSPGAFDALVEVGLGRGLVSRPLVGALVREGGRRLLPALGDEVPQHLGLPRHQLLDQRGEELLGPAADQRDADLHLRLDDPAAAGGGRLEPGGAADLARCPAAERGLPGAGADPALGRPPGVGLADPPVLRHEGAQEPRAALRQLAAHLEDGAPAGRLLATDGAAPVVQRRGERGRPALAGDRPPGRLDVGGHVVGGAQARAHGAPVRTGPPSCLSAGWVIPTRPARAGRSGSPAPGRTACRAAGRPAPRAPRPPRRPAGRGCAPGGPCPR